MSTKQNDGGPAFPRTAYVNQSTDRVTEYDSTAQSGMSLRDYAELQIIPAVISMFDRIPKDLPEYAGKTNAEVIVDQAKSIVDAWMKGRREC